MDPHELGDSDRDAIDGRFFAERHAIAEDVLDEPPCVVLDHGSYLRSVSPTSKWRARVGSLQLARGELPASGIVPRCGGRKASDAGDVDRPLSTERRPSMHRAPEDVRGGGGGEREVVRVGRGVPRRA